VQWLAIGLVIAASAGITATRRPQPAALLTSPPEPATRR
jgi:threonine/homoserine efflux transporter RhtA